MTFNSSTDCWEGTKIIQVATNKKSKEPMSVEFTFAKPSTVSYLDSVQKFRLISASLSEPLMNLSGHAVISSFRKHVSPPSSNHLLVIHDSLEHEPLKISPKNGGSAQGHNGVRSVISSLREDKFYRIRIGIGRGNAEVDRHVLGRLSKSEQHFWSVEGLNPIWQHVERIVLVTT